ncbi:hypothetical protein HAX54_027727 [Datura stramonium]|uniref:Uncharacterized protein n=1 Tax=Datura stramonium TaxID=4076 RepID=A0ABS8V5T6_DATST|nr:hypothetical protein [Datura stramonium]
MKVVKEGCRFKCRNGNLLIHQCKSSYNEGRYDRICLRFCPTSSQKQNLVLLLIYLAVSNSELPIHSYWARPSAAHDGSPCRKVLPKSCSMLLILSVRLLGPRDPGSWPSESSSQSAVQVTEHTFRGGQAIPLANQAIKHTFLGAQGSHLSASLLICDSSVPFANQAIKYTFFGAQGSSPHSQPCICT